MNTVIYKSLPQDGKKIREEVFISEQGFKNEYDEIDNFSTHYVLYDGKNPVAVCRSFYDETIDSFVIGRLAVKKAYRGKGLGSKILADAEKELIKQGAKSVSLHSQVAASKFYESCGYTQFGKIDFDEDCPHIWMKKVLCK